MYFLEQLAQFILVYFLTLLLRYSFHFVHRFILPMLMI